MSSFHRQDAVCTVFELENCFTGQKEPNICVSLAVGAYVVSTVAGRRCILHPSLTQSYPIFPPPNPNHVLHGPWLEPGNRYKSWGAKALSPTCESRVADLTCWGHLTGDFGHIWSSSVGRLILYRDDRSLVFGETYLLCIYFMQLFLIQVFVIIIFDWIKWIPCNAFWKSNYISYWMLQHIHHTNTNKSRKNNTFVDISFTKELKRTSDMAEVSSKMTSTGQIGHAWLANRT